MAATKTGGEALQAASPLSVPLSIDQLQGGMQVTWCDPCRLLCTNFCFLQNANHRAILPVGHDWIDGFLPVTGDYEVIQNGGRGHAGSACRPHQQRGTEGQRGRAIAGSLRMDGTRCFFVPQMAARQSTGQSVGHRGGDP